MLAVGLLAGLLYVLFPALFHPHTHVVLLTGADYLSPAVPALEFAAEEVAGFKALRPALYALEGEQPPLVVPALSRPEALSAWGEACRRLPLGERDTLLVYAAAHGVCGDGLPQLMCGSYDPAQPAAGVCSVSELLQLLVASRTGGKVLILDASRLGTDPLAGSVVNEFPELLQRDVLKTRDPRLWVLSAAASLQRSHVSTALQRLGVRVPGHHRVKWSGGREPGRDGRSGGIAPLCVGQRGRLGPRAERRPVPADARVAQRGRTLGGQRAAGADLDAPPGAFDRPDDVVEIGVDVDRDRELEGEQVLSLRADRQATVRVARFAPGGVMTLLAQVDDYLVTLPPVGLENAPANVIARIIVGTRRRWSDAEPVVFDALPPRATRIELDPDRALLHGTDLTVLSWVTDDGLSGMAKVEVGLDIQRSGQLATEPKPAAAYQDAAGRWVAKLATGDYPPGQYTLLVRVTDNLNNSRLVKVRDIRLLTEQEAKEAQKKLTNQVTRTVLFGSQGVPGAVVELAAAEPKPEDAAAKKPSGDAAAEAEPPTAIAPVQMPTDEQGRFTFPKVAPGDYRISAKVLLHNKIRQAAQDITVPTPPKRLEPLRLEL